MCVCMCVCVCVILTNKYVYCHVIITWSARRCTPTQLMRLESFNPVSAMCVVLEVDPYHLRVMPVAVLGVWSGYFFTCAHCIHILHVRHHTYIVFTVAKVLGVNIL